MFIDVDDGAIRRVHEQRPPPLLIDDRALRRETGVLQSSLNLFERFVGDEVERKSVAPFAVSRV